MNNPPRWHLALPFLALAALVLLFAWRLAFTNGILGRGDLLLYFYPYWDYRVESLLAGRLPLWNPLLFMGAPLLANSQAGVLYPLNWLVAPLPAPEAVKVSALAHLMLASAGAYSFGRRAMGLSVLPAFAGAAVFVMGGYLPAQVEHINQLQGLAWLPWLMLAAHRLALDVHRRWRHALWLSLVLALQLLAGHTQTAVIATTGAGVYALVLGWRRPERTNDERGRAVLPRWQRLWQWSGGAPVILAWLGAAAVAAALLAAAQLLPTLELSGQSLRGGGLPMRVALSFSLNPLLLGRSLLPGYSRMLFSEFVGYLGVAGIVLAGLGLSRRRGRLALAVVAGLGLLFALGAYNPAYVGLAALPPFSLFRAPARWLALLAFGGAMLAGGGLESLSGLGGRRRYLWLAPPVLLAALAPLAAGLTPAGETGPLGWPAGLDWAGWGLALAASAVLLGLPRAWAWRPSALAAVALVELFAAGQGLSLNQVTTPEAYTSTRPALTQLLVEAETNAPPARFLSMSGLRFDPGDAAELTGALADELDQAAFTDFIIATKHKEVLSPNLPLAWGVPAVDGYDGGVLPLRTYAAFTSLFSGVAAPDGRLRENMTAAPDPRLLALINGQYLVTDKVRDTWIEGVFYDLEFQVVLAAGEQTSIAFVPAFQATALGVVAGGAGGSVEVTTTDGQVLTLPIEGSRVQLPRPLTPAAITLLGPLSVRGLSLVDERTGAYQSLTLGPYRLVHSGDVKVYEHHGVLPRAFVAPEALTAGDDDALALLVDENIDLSRTVILADATVPQPGGGAARAAPDATIVSYAPEAITIHAAGPGYLVLTDSHYPGWTATLDGAPAEILRADVMFRAVVLPPGEHVVEFRYQPWWLGVGFGLSALAWAAAVVALSAPSLRGRRQHSAS